MTRGKILFITVLMGVALLGLVIMQLNWIRHDYEIQEDKFSQQVNDALRNAINNLETGESVHLIARNMGNEFLEDSMEQFFRDPVLPVPPNDISFVIPEAPEPPEPPETPKAHKTHKAPKLEEEFSIVTEIDTGLHGEVRVIKRNSGNHQVVSIEMRGPDSLEELAELNKDLHEQQLAIHLQQEAIKASEKAIELQMESQKAELEKQKVELKVRKMNRVFQKMAVEYDRRAIGILDRVSPAVVDSMVGVELKNSGVFIPYSIELLSGNTDSIVWQRKPLTDSQPEKVYTSTLFPSDIINKNDFIRLGFTGTFSYIISSMWIMLLSSAVFTIIIIVVFSYTVIIIFRQKKLSDIKNDFINNMTHELKTPIATIALASEAITNAEVIKDATKVLYYTSIIKDENKRMNTHVENILQMAQFDKKDFAQDLVSINMHQVIEEAVEKMQLQIQQKNGKVIFEPHAAKFMILADPRFISLVIMNLLDNALKYNQSEPIITISTKNINESLQISIQDNGIGMNSEQSSKVFEKFYRVTSGNLHNVKGFGLGLSYVKAIVTAHGGTIEVSSEMGKGSCFVITLPTQKETA